MIPPDLTTNLDKCPISGNILDLLQWAVRSGPTEWCDNVTYSTNATIYQLYITSNVFTVDAAKTLTSIALRPLIVVADTIIINGTITASGKGCALGKRCTNPGWPFIVSYNEETSVTRNYCLCGSGGGHELSGSGGGAFANGGLLSAAGNPCNLTAAQLKQLLLSPSFNIFQMGMGGGGGGVGGKNGGGLILLVGRSIIIGPSGSVLANGLDTAAAGGAGGGGCIGLVGHSLSVHATATLSADGGATSSTGMAGGDGAVAQIEI